MADTQRSVKLRIVADAGTAKETLDEIAFKADEIDGKKSTVRVGIQSGTTKADLDEITAKADALGIKNVTFTVKADTKPARAELDALKLKTDSLSKNLSGPSGLIGKFRQLFSMGSGGVLGEAGPPAGGGPIGGSTLTAIGLLSPAIGALAVEVTGLVSGFAAAGAGAGAFYLLAHPTISSLQTDYKSLSSATQAYQKAQEKANLDPSKSNLKVEATALENLRAVRQGMTKDEGSAASGIAKLSAEYHKMTNAFRPEVFKIFNDGLKVANNLLPFLTPMANAFAGALDGLLKQFDKFTQSKGFKDWMTKFTADIGPSVTAIGQGIGKLVPALAQLLTLMSKKDIVNSINIAFTILTGTVKVLTYGISTFMHNYDSFTHTVSSASHALAAVFVSMGHSIEAVFNSVRRAVAAWFGAVRGIFSGAVSAVSRMISGIRTFLGRGVALFRQLPGMFRSALSALPSEMFNIGSNIIWGIIRGVESAVGTLVGYIENVGHWISNAFSSVLHIFSPSRVFADHGKNIILGLVQGISGNANLATGAVSNLGRSVSSSLNVNATTAGRRGNTVYLQPQITVTGIVGDAGATGREIAKSLNEYLRQTGQGQLVGA